MVLILEELMTWLRRVKDAQIPGFKFYVFYVSQLFGLCSFKCLFIYLFRLRWVLAAAAGSSLPCVKSLVVA